MLSVAQCRTLLPGAGDGLTDLEVERLRDGFAVVAGLALDGARRAGVSRPGEEALDMVPSEQREDIQERAAIMEFDGGLPRDRAEWAAFAIVLGGRKES
jgi:hypothetical protein